MLVSFLFDSFSQKERKRPLHFYCGYKQQQSREITHTHREKTHKDPGAISPKSNRMNATQRSTLEGMG